MPFTKTSELNSAAQNNDLASVKEFFSLPKDEAPEHKDISRAFKLAALSGSLEVVEYFCQETEIYSFTVNEALNKIHYKCINSDNISYQSHRKMISYLCALSGESGPTPEETDHILVLAGSFGDWELFKSLCELPEGYAPSVNKVGSCFANYLCNNLTLPFEVMTHLFEKSKIIIAKDKVSWTLEKLCVSLENNPDNKVWRYISYLCALTGINKPEQRVIDIALKVAVKFQQTDLVRNLCLLRQDNAPSSSVIAKEFSAILYVTPSLQASDILKSLFELSANKPSSNLTNIELKTMRDTNFSLYRENIKYLCNSTKAANYTISAVLAAAAKNSDWEFVTFLIQNEINPPNRESISKLLKKAGEVASELPFETIRDLFEISINNPTNDDLNALIIAITKNKISSADSKFWDYLTYLLSLKSGYLIEQEAQDTVAQTAFLYKKLDIFYSVSCSLKVATELFIKALNQADDSDSLEMMKFFCEKAVNKPNNAQISRALILAAANFSGAKDKVTYLYSLAVNQEAIDKLLEAATFHQDWDFVKQICDNEAKPPSQQQIGMILFKTSHIADPLPFEIMKYLFEKSVVKPSSKDVDSTLTAMAWEVFTKKEFKEYLLDLKGDNKPSQDAINIVFRLAVKANNYYFVEKLLKRGAHSQNTVDYVFLEIVTNPAAFEMTKLLFQFALKPSQDAIKKAGQNILEGLSSSQIQDSMNYEDIKNFFKNGGFFTELALFLKSVKEPELVEELKPTQTQKQKQKPIQILTQNQSLKDQSNLSSKISSSGAMLFQKPLKIEIKSCLSDSQFEAIKARINELKDEIDNSCFGFFSARKSEKIEGLKELIRLSEMPNMQLGRAIRLIEEDKRFPGLRAGFNNRTAELLDGFKHSQSPCVISNSNKAS
ncbi:MAG: hypothetical protein H0U70_10590 [Tatlockia sp.]|nr:hypothetical protein [Tatlockia sp.]